MDPEGSSVRLCKGNKKDTSYLKSDQEEADTKIVLHALDATANGATEIRIHYPDTDVFILSLRRYPDLCQNTVFVSGKGQNHREITLQPVVRGMERRGQGVDPRHDTTPCFWGHH